MMKDKELGLISLIAMIIGSTIGSGVFTITGDMAAAGAYSGAVMLGWGICGLGIFCLLQCFYGLNKERPDLTNGVFSYAREGFGEYVGFTSAYGYWISALFTNVSYMALLFTTCNYFLPIFENGNNLLSTVLGSVIIWITAIIVIRGIPEAAFLNIFATVAKLLPLFIFIIAVIILNAFKLELFLDNFWGDEYSMPLMDQIKSTSTATIWSFIGIESAVVLSGRAKKNSDIGKSTFIGFGSIFIIYLLVAILSLGVVSHEQLAHLENPQMSGILEKAVGPWGAILVRVGIILSIVGALLGWTILACDCPMSAAQQGVFMKMFAKTNKYGAPYYSTVITTVIIQFFLILGYFSESAYLLFYNLCVSMIIIPYLLTAAFYFKTGITKQGLSDNANYAHALFFGLLGTIYGFYMIYAGGLHYLLATTILYAPGYFIYQKGKKEKKQPVFDRRYELLIAMLIAFLGALSLALLLIGEIDL